MLQINRRSTQVGEHAFYGEVCDAMKSIEEVVVVGSSTAQADFKHFIEKHRPLVAKYVVGYESVDHPTDPQLVALARQYFAKRERMGAEPSS